MRKVLIIQTAFIGDVILATSLIASVKQAYPTAKIHFLLRAGNEQILEEHPHVDVIYVWDKSKKVSSLLSNIKKLRAENFDLCLNIQRFFNSGLFTIFSKSRITIGFDKNPLSYFFSKKIKHQIPFIQDGVTLHEIDRNFQLLKAVSDSPGHAEPMILSLPKLSFNKRPYSVMAPSSVWFTKQLHKDKWIELSKRVDHTIYMIGARSDKEYIDSIAQEPHIINMAGELSLRESAALMKDAHTVYVNDSAPLHLASAVNANTVAFFCSTTPSFGYGPKSDKSKVVSVDLPCKPCGLHGHQSCPQKHFQCSSLINLDEVFSD